MYIEQKNDVNFHEMKIGDSLAADCDLVYSCFSEVYRLYIKRDEERGFKAVAIYNHHSDNTKECWIKKGDESLLVDVIFTANACFDGTRQLNFNNCINHPCLDRIVFLIKALRKVELEICPDAEQMIRDNL